MLNITGRQWHGLCCDAGIHSKTRNNRKYMKLYKILLAIVAAAAGVGLLSSAQPTPITGMLNIAGTANFNTSPLTTASTATFTDVPVLGGNTRPFSSLAVPRPERMASHTFDSPTIPHRAC